MKICLVTAFPPSRGGLSEYGFHIAQELQRNPLLSLTVLADVVPESHDEEESSTAVLRCWTFNDRRSARNLMDTIREINPDVVWFNLLFTTFGHDPWPAIRGLSLPLQTRLAGYYTHVTLHHLVDNIDVEGAGVRFPWLYRAAGIFSTKMLLWSNSVSVLMPAYRTLLQKKYNGENVHFRTHGILAKNPEYPAFSRRGTPMHRILAFGKWGTYKRPEALIEAFQLIADKHPNTKLVIAGGDHPRVPGYIASLARKYENSRIEFTGYVPEEKIADLFRGASVLVMPYSSATGASGVAHLACAYGVPIISSDVPDFAHMAEEEGMAIDFYRTGDANDLAEKLIALLQSPERQKAMGLHNFSAALRMTMPSVIHEYVRHFHVAQQTRALKSIRRYRKLPTWISKSFLGKALLRGSSIRNNRLRPSPARKRPNGKMLVGKDGQAGRSLGTTGISNNGDDIATAARLGWAGVGAASVGHTSARAEKSNGGQHGEHQEKLERTLPIYVADPHASRDGEWEHARIEDVISPLPLIESDVVGARNGENGAGAAAIAANGNGRERAGHVDGEI